MRKKKDERKGEGFVGRVFFRGRALNFFLSYTKQKGGGGGLIKKKGKRPLAKTHHHHRQSAHSSRTPNGIIIDESASRAIRETRGVCDRPRVVVVVVVVVVVRGNDPTVRRLGFGGHRVGLSAGVGPRRGQRLFEMERTGDAELRAQRDTGARRVQGGMEVFRGEALVSLSLSLSLFTRGEGERRRNGSNTCNPIKTFCFYSSLFVSCKSSAKRSHSFSL